MMKKLEPPAHPSPLGTCVPAGVLVCLIIEGWGSALWEETVPLELPHHNPHLDFCLAHPGAPWEKGDTGPWLVL